MNDCANEIVEMRMMGEVRKILLGRVNEIIDNRQLVMPLFEASDYKDMMSTIPNIKISDCERTEKERIILVDAYSLTISFIVPENTDSELYCYGYIAAVCRALGENPTLGGIVDRVSVTDTKVIPPKAANCGMEWEVLIKLRITVETMGSDKC